MRWILTGAGLLLVCLLVPLLLLSLLVVVIIAPAVHHAANACGNGAAGTVPTGPWRVPVQQAYALTSGFGNRLDPAYGRWQLHDGQDIATQPGPGPIVAASVGKVIQAGPNGGYGNSVTLQHAGGVTTLYGHMSSFAAGITVGATVKIGQQLGVEGSTGASTGNHLHFQVHVNNHPTDPVPFMATHGAPLNGQPVAPSPQTPTPTGTPSTPGTNPTRPVAAPGLPAPGTPRQDSVHNTPLPVPAQIDTLYHQAASQFHLPWTLLAGIGMEETGHGRTTAVSSAGAQGVMQMLPATFTANAVDGDHDGHTDITNPADNIFSAAHYLAASGATTGPDGIRRAIFAYNHATWYVNDVLYYAQTYSTGTGAQTCPGPTGTPAPSPAPRPSSPSTPTTGRNRHA